MLCAPINILAPGGRGQVPPGTPASSRDPSWAYRARRSGRAAAPCRSQLLPEGETAADGLQEEEAPKFRPFVAQNALQQRMVQFRRSFSFGEAGTLRVEPVAEEWVPAAADLLTDTFAESMGYVAVYTNFLRRQIRKYLMAHMNLPPKTVVLIAILVPPADAEAAPDVAGHAERAEPSGAAPEDAAPSGWLPEGMAAAGRAGGEAPASPAPPRGAAAVVVGAVEVSFTAATRARFLTLNSPPDRPYLCNMAIADRHRGRGYGAALLAAAEELVVEAGESAVFLHVRLQDPPARALYTKAGYVPQAEDWPLVRLVGQDPRFLLKKELPPSGRSWLG